MIPVLKVILSLCGSKNLFKYFHDRYIHNILKTLDNTIHLRDKIRSLSHKIKFLNSCSQNYIISAYIAWHILRIKCRNTISIKQVFLTKSCTFLTCSSLLEPSIGYFGALSVIHYIFWIKSVLLNSCQKVVFLLKIERKLREFGSYVPTDKHAINLSNYCLSDSDKLFLSQGLDFFYCPKKIDLFSNLEFFFFFFSEKHLPNSDEQLSGLKGLMT